MATSMVKGNPVKLMLSFAFPLLITIPPVISGQLVLSFVLCNRSSNRLLSLSLS